MNWRKVVIPAAFAAMLFTAASGFGQAKSESTNQDRAKVLMHFAKNGTIGPGCSTTIGVIEQSMLQVEGVRNAKVDTKNNGIQVSYDPGKTNPQKIIVAFNKENPDTPLQSSGTKEAK